MRQTLWLIESTLIEQDNTKAFAAQLDVPSTVLQEMQVGDYVAPKTVTITTPSRKVAMQIHALAIIQAKNSYSIQLAWQLNMMPKTWLHYVHRGKFWRVEHSHWMNQALINFVLHDQGQDLAAFLHSPYWYKQQYTDARFAWTGFYQAIAQALLRYQQQREPLVAYVLELAQRYQLTYLLSKNLQDICPFTVLGIFNRGISSQKRHAIAQDLAQFLQVSDAAPQNFDGIPILNNQSSCFFAVGQSGVSQQINALWQFFATAIAYAYAVTPQLETQFIQQYDQVSHQYAVGWNLSMGLFWLAPECYASLDSQSQQYIQQDLAITLNKQGAKGRCSGQDYLDALFALEYHFQTPYSLPRNFAELALYAWEQLGGLKSLANDNDQDLTDLHAWLQDLPVQSYDLQQLLHEGCFLSLDTLQQLQQRVLNKKNLILQGASGTGKTWLAKRLAYAIVGHKTQGHVEVMQFHANTSYEDFIRGWRPLANEQGQHQLQLVDGPFLQLIQKAQQYPNDRFVMVIEEINRGQTAQIFGEMLTLLESSKRHPQEAFSLTYAKAQEKIYIPDNLYLIATMNSVDRSLTALDFALRRRFAFATLVPNFNSAWFTYVVQHGVSADFLKKIQKDMQDLNHEITHTAYLGQAFMLGHSYFTPAQPILDQQAWYLDIVESEILPILEEYWSDDVGLLDEWQARLLELP